MRWIKRNVEQKTHVGLNRTKLPYMPNSENKNTYNTGMQDLQQGKRKNERTNKQKRNISSLLVIIRIGTYGVI